MIFFFQKNVFLQFQWENLTGASDKLINFCPKYVLMTYFNFLRSLGRKQNPCTRSNLEIEDDILEEEEEESFLNEYNFEHRRLSASLPFGLNLVDRPPLETTVWITSKAIFFGKKAQNAKEIFIYIPSLAFSIWYMRCYRCVVVPWKNF